jgi:hypothetical protein
VAYENFSTLESRGGAGRQAATKIWCWFANLSNGHVVREVPTGTPKALLPDSIGVGDVTSLVVKPDGAVAWIAATVAGEGRYQLHAVDGTVVWNVGSCRHSDSRLDGRIGDGQAPGIVVHVPCAMRSMDWAADPSAVGDQITRAWTL